MDVYFISIFIIGAVIFIKVLIIICIYVCRARSNNRRPLPSAQRHDASAFPHDPHTMRSAIINFEETPQQIISVPPGSDPTLSNPMLAPPPYNLVTQGGQKNEKPPDYEEVMSPAAPPTDYGEYAVCAPQTTGSGGGPPQYSEPSAGGSSDEPQIATERNA